MASTREPRSRLLDPLLGGRRLLLVAAATTEAQAVAHGVADDASDRRIAWEPIPLTDRVDLLVSGVGKSNASGATARSLDSARHGLVVSLGVGGALPAPGTEAYPHEIGDIVRCQHSVFADEGVHLPKDEWATMGERGFGPRQGLPDERSMEIPCDAQAIALLADRFPSIGSGATVSACSGSDTVAQAIAARTGCSVEAMEGAAVGLAVLRIDPSIPFLELRVISNRTGSDQRWNLRAALAGLSDLAAAL